MKSTKLLRGNYKTKSKKVNMKEESEETQVTKFETETLKKLGGNISYVKRRKLVSAERVKAILSSRTRSQTTL